MLNTIIRSARMLLPGAGLLLLAVAGVQGCKSDRLLDVTDPDIINPSDVTSADAAEALRAGALGRLSGTTSGGESFFLLGGLLADEFRSGGPFQQHQETDARAILPTNSVLEGAWYRVNRARTASNQARVAIIKFSPMLTANIGQMYFVRGYAETQIAENYCNGTPLSELDASNNLVYGAPLTNVEVYKRALATFDSALAVLPAVGTSARGDTVRFLTQIGRGRVLLDQGDYQGAQAAVAGVPTTFRFFTAHSQVTVDNQIWALNNNISRYIVGDRDGKVGLNFATANDPRVPVCQGGDVTCKANGVSATVSFDGNFGKSGSGFLTGGPFYVQMIWPSRESDVAIVTGVEARLIEAEAQLQAGQTATWLATLNSLRASVATLKQPSAIATPTTTTLPPLADPGTVGTRVDLMFRERAFWLYATGHRLPDMRRLIRPIAAGGYARDVNTVYPNGTHFLGGSFGTDVNIPVPQSETNNPKFTGCLDRNP